MTLSKSKDILYVRNKLRITRKEFSDALGFSYEEEKKTKILGTRQ